MGNNIARSGGGGGGVNATGDYWIDGRGGKMSWTLQWC
jgi:hypothetical protein